MERQADKLPRNEIAANRAAFWADKVANADSATAAKPGKLEIAAAMAKAAEAEAVNAGVALWNARYMAACQPVRLAVIEGGKA